jgi:hypothetical protein
VAAEQALRILAERAAAAALAALALDAGGVAAVASELGGQLPKAGLESANIQRVDHGATISPPKAGAQADWLR